MHLKKELSALRVIICAELRGTENRFSLGCMLGIRFLSWYKILLL